MYFHVHLGSCCHNLPIAQLSVEFGPFYTTVLLKKTPPKLTNKKQIKNTPNQTQTLESSWNFHNTYYIFMSENLSLQ